MTPLMCCCIIFILSSRSFCRSEAADMPGLLSYGRDETVLFNWSTTSSAPGSIGRTAQTRQQLSPLKCSWVYLYNGNGHLCRVLRWMMLLLHGMWSGLGYAPVWFQGFCLPFAFSFVRRRLHGMCIPIYCHPIPPQYWPIRES